MANGHYVVPKLVEDASLKRARTEIEIGGETKDAIRVTSVGGSGGLDSQGVSDGLALAPSGSVASGSAIDTTRRINEVLGTTSDQSVFWNQNGSINGRIRYISDELLTTNTFLPVEVGTRLSEPWDGVDTSGATLNAIAKRTSNVTEAIRTRMDDVRNYIGSASQAAWSGSGNGNLNAIAKRTSNDTHATTTATGTQSDAAWSGSGNATIIALLKGIYNKL